MPELKERKETKETREISEDYKLLSKSIEKLKTM